MTLPDGVEDEDVNAHFEDGMLEIIVKGGAASHEPNRIEIGGGES
jgi:HSP20 family molecular chaperone IbpA